jgi:hypothetical protein
MDLKPVDTPCDLTTVRSLGDAMWPILLGPCGVWSEVLGHPCLRTS